MNNNEELKHHGVLGMKWGKRKAQIKAKRKAKREAMIADNDKRVGTYGKTMVKVGDTIGIVATLNGMSFANRVIARVGGTAVRSMRANSKYSDAQIKVVAGASLAAMAGITIKSLKAANTMGKDIALTKQYDNRQQDKKIKEMRKRISNLENK